MESYLKLLLAHQAIPKERHRKTFMDVAGFPRRENVCSNILAFYLDPAAEHDLGDLVLSSFFIMSGVEEKDLPPMDGSAIRREVWTSQGKRMDLVLDHPEWIIGIENKIDHALNNDLKEYATEIDNLGSVKKRRFKVVLGLRLVKESLEGKFQSHTYAQLWEQVRLRLGSRLAKADPKWTIHLIDFMENTERLGPSPMDLKPTDRFFVDHDEQIRELVKDYYDFKARLARRIELLWERMDVPEVGERLRNRVWIAREGCLVFDLKMPGADKASLDLWLFPSGWELQVFGRDADSHAVALQAAADLLPESTPTTGNNRYVLGRWPIGVDLAELDAAIVDWIDKLNRSAEVKQASRKLH